MAVGTASLLLAGAALAAPGIEITSVPAYGTSGSMQGYVTGVAYAACKVAVYIQIEGAGWWTKPTEVNPTVPVNPDGTFSASVVSGGVDDRATIFCAALIPIDSTPPQAAGVGRIPAGLDAVAIAFRERYGRTLEFAGRTWAVKEAPLPVGPGPNAPPYGNYFSDLTSDVWVDPAGLHLTIHQHDGQWWTTEVILLEHLGHGTYCFKTNSRTDILDPNAVLGLFTWDAYGDDVASGDSHHREIDFEDSRWQVSTDPNTQAVVQPYDVVGNRHRYRLPDLSGDAALTRFFRWQASTIESVALTGHHSPETYPPEAVFDEWTYEHAPGSQHYVPPVGRERVHLNLWLSNAPPAPSDGNPVEVVITDFSFTRLPGVAPTLTTQPESANLSAGATVTFTAAADGTAPLAWQWRKDDEPIPGATAPAFTLENVQTGDAGRYTVRVSNADGAATSDAAELSVDPTPVAPSITTAPAPVDTIEGRSVALRVSVVGTLPCEYEWRKDGVEIPGATGATCVLAHIGPADAGAYTVTITNGAGSATNAPAAPVVVRPRPAGKVTAWGSGGNGQTTVPGDLANVVAVAGGYAHSIALLRGGNVIAWGSNNDGQASVPPGLSDVVAIAAGGTHNLALLRGGTVIGWGSNQNGESTAPEWLTDVVAIAAGGQHSLAVKRDGTVVAWGWDLYGQASPPPDLAGVVAVAGGTYHSLALQRDGTVTGWGKDDDGQASPPSDLTGVVAFAAGCKHSLALKIDGTVVGWGSTSNGQSRVPGDAIDIVEIGAGGYHNVALNRGGTVNAWGAYSAGQAPAPAGLSGVAGIGTGDQHCLAIVPTSYDLWQATHFTSAELRDPAVCGAGADPELDMLANLLEFAFGLDPRRADFANLPRPAFVGTDYAVSFAEPPGVDAIVYGADRSTDLVVWTPVPDSGEGATHAFRVPTDGVQRLFLRLRAAAP